MVSGIEADSCSVGSHLPVLICLLFCGPQDVALSADVQGVLWGSGVWGLSFGLSLCCTHNFSLCLLAHSRIHPCTHSLTHSLTLAGAGVKPKGLLSSMPSLGMSNSKPSTPRGMAKLSGRR